MLWAPWVGVFQWDAAVGEQCEAPTHGQGSQAPQGTACQLSLHTGFISGTLPPISGGLRGSVWTPMWTLTTCCNWEPLSASGSGRMVLAVPTRPKPAEITHQDGRMPVSTGAVRGSPTTAPHLGLGPGTPGIGKSARRVCETLSDTPWQ